MDNEKPLNNVSSVNKDGITDPNTDLSPEEIKRFYAALLKLVNDANNIFFKQSHFWPKHKNDPIGSEQNDYQWILHRYRNALNNVQTFALNPHRAAYKENLEELRDRIADKSDLVNLRATSREYMNAKKAKKEGYPEPEPQLMRKAMHWIEEVDKLTSEFCTKVDAMYPPDQQQQQQ